jgi:hypothetical protein
LSFLLSPLYRERASNIEYRDIENSNIEKMGTSKNNWGTKIQNASIPVIGNYKNTSLPVFQELREIPQYPCFNLS